MELSNSGQVLWVGGGSWRGDRLKSVWLGLTLDLDFSGYFWSLSPPKRAKHFPHLRPSFYPHLSDGRKQGRFSPSYRHAS